MVTEPVEKNQKLYEVRLFLFGLIPLWEVRRTKRELKEYARLLSNKKRILEVVFIDDEEEKI